MSKEYTPPELDLDAFNCPNCGAYAHQFWFKGALYDDNDKTLNFLRTGQPLVLSICNRCKDYVLWVNGEIVSF
jgi:hypothetical protein